MTLTASRIEITPTAAALGTVITGIDVSRSVDPEVILQLKQVWRVDASLARVPLGLSGLS
jgi:taurine dioxygenase